ncbi:MAG: UPF0147 family protein [Candidatus Woesearchaeota archaeon]
MTRNKAKIQESINEVLSIINFLKEDDTVPKNVKSKLDIIVSNLNEECELSLKVSKCLHILDEISEDLNLQPFIRTYIWNISSILEKLNS